MALARALAPHPKVLLLDEPLSALDYKLRKEMQGELKRMQAATATTFVFVTHDQEEALAMSDRIAVMAAGRILQVGTPEDIHDRPSDRFVADFIGESNIVPVDLVTVDGHGRGRARLPNGAEITVDCEGMPPSAAVTVSIRPSHLRLVPEGDGEITGRITGRVYAGTDIQILVTSDEGLVVTVRQQSDAQHPRATTIGSRVSVKFPAGKARLLKG